MKKIVSTIVILMTLTIMSCSKEDANKTDNIETKKENISTTEKNTSENYKENIINWNEITDKGLDKDKLIENIDTELLEYIASELQQLVDEEVAAEKENPNILITEGWTRVFKTQRYANVIKLGKKAMKSLYFIVNESNYMGQYEYICAYALYELSGYDFAEADGILKWTNSKELIKLFNEKVVKDRKGIED